MSLPGSTTFTTTKPDWKKKKRLLTLEERVEALEKIIKPNPENPYQPPPSQPPGGISPNLPGGIDIIHGDPYSGIDDDEWTFPIFPPDGGKPWHGDRDDIVDIIEPVLPPEIIEPLPSDRAYYGKASVEFTYRRTGGGLHVVDAVVIQAGNATNVLTGADAAKNGFQIKLEDTGIDSLADFQCSGYIYTVSDPAQLIELEPDANQETAAGTNYRYAGFKVTEQVTGTAVVSPTVTIGISVFFTYQI